MMADYDLLAHHYDAVTGDSAPEAALLRDAIERRHRRAVTLLDVACGTGAITAVLARAYQVSGLDISPGMLQPFGGNYLVIRVRTADGRLFRWRIEVFELQRDGTYRLLTQAIEMRSFPVGHIREALGRRFTDIEVLGADGGPAGSEDEDRIWLACTRPS